MENYRKVEMLSWDKDVDGNDCPRHFGWYFQPITRSDPDRPVTDALDIAAILARPCRSSASDGNVGGNGGSLVRGTPRRIPPGGSPGAAKRLPSVLRP